MHNLFIIFVLILSNSLFAQRQIVGNGQLTTETRNVSSFSGIQSFGSLDVEIQSAPQDGKIQLHGESNIISLIEVNVENGILILKYKNNTSFRTKKGVKITLQAQNLKSLALHGSGSIVTKGTQKSSNLSLTIKGSGDIETNIDVNDLSTTVQGSGSLKVSGKASNLKAVNTGSGDLDAFDLMAQNVEVTKSGSGDSNINCSGNLTIQTTGSGDVHYRGNPQSIVKSVKGSGNVEKVR